MPEAPCPHYLHRPPRLPATSLPEAPASPPFSSTQLRRVRFGDWLKKKREKQYHGRAERRYSMLAPSAHASSASPRIGWRISWRATGDQLSEVGHPEMSATARTRAARGSKLQLSETRGRTPVLVVGVLSVAHTRRNYRQVLLSPSHLCFRCVACESLGRLCRCCAAVGKWCSPLSFTNPHLTAYEQLVISSSWMNSMGRGS